MAVWKPITHFYTGLFAFLILVENYWMMKASVLDKQDGLRSETQICIFKFFFFLKIVCRNNNSQPWTDTWVQFTDRVNHTNFKSSDKWRHCDRVLICTSENNVLMKHSHPQSLFSIIYPRLWNKMHVTRFEIYKNTCKWSKNQHETHTEGFSVMWRWAWPSLSAR